MKDQPDARAVLAYGVVFAVGLLPTLNAYSADRRASLVSGQRQASLDRKFLEASEALKTETARDRVETGNLEAELGQKSKDLARVENEAERASSDLARRQAREEARRATEERKETAARLRLKGQRVARLFSGTWEYAERRIYTMLFSKDGSLSFFDGQQMFQTSGKGSWERVSEDHIRIHGFNEGSRVCLKTPNLPLPPGGEGPGVRGESLGSSLGVGRKAAFPSPLPLSPGRERGVLRHALVPRSTWRSTETGYFWRAILDTTSRAPR